VMPISPPLTFTIPIFISLIFGSEAAGTASSRHWQLAFRYDSEVLTLTNAEPLSPLRKNTRTPGISGAPGSIGCRVDWLDREGRVIESAQTKIPIGERHAMEEGPCRISLPENDAFVLRVLGPPVESEVASIRLRATEADALGASALHSRKAFNRIADRTFPIRRRPKVPKVGEPFEGPFNVEKVHDTGDDENRFVLVFIGDGYTLENHAAGDFSEDVTQNLAALMGRAPWDRYLAATNIYRIDVASFESFPPGDRPYPDTYFDARFRNGRLLVGDHGKELALAAADEYVGAGVWDKIVLIVNTTTYGGSGGQIAVASVNEAMEELFLHEFGHSFAGVADEYFPEVDGGGTREDSEPNVDKDFSGPALKWLVWVEPDTPLPTPDTDKFEDVVGAFEGARYWRTGLYRPWRNCQMRSFGRPFCPVCKEAHVLSFLDLISLVDRSEPPVESARTIPPEGLEIAVDPIPLAPLTYEWSVDGTPWTSVTGPSLLITQDDLAGVSAEVRLRVNHPTDLVRKEELFQTFLWIVAVEPSVTNTPTAGQILTPTPTATASSTAYPTGTPTPIPSPTFTFDFDVVKNFRIEPSDLLKLLKENRFTENESMEGSLFHFCLYWEKSLN